ncbi:MAG: hypothetical protein ACLQG3_08865 [Terracidiphilus sp.]
MTLLGAAIVLLGAAFFAGARFGGYFVPGAGVDPIAATRPSNQFQLAIRNRPSVKVFENFLNFTAEKNWPGAYKLLGPSWAKFNIDKPDDLERIYRRTLRYELYYYIPDSVTEDKEIYNVDFAFWDAVPSVPAIDEVTNSSLSEVLAPAKIDALTQALANELPNDFVVPDSEKNQLPVLTEKFVDRLKLSDLVLHEDDIVEMLGDELGLQPIVQGNSYFQTAAAGKEQRRFLKVVLVKQNGQWLLDSYDSFMVAKR